MAPDRQTFQGVNQVDDPAAGPFTMAFVYTKEGMTIVKGRNTPVMNEVIAKYDGKAVVCYITWLKPCTSGRDLCRRVMQDKPTRKQVQWVSYIKGVQILQVRHPTATKPHVSKVTGPDFELNDIDRFGTIRQHRQTYEVAIFKYKPANRHTSDYMPNLCFYVRKMPRRWLRAYEDAYGFREKLPTRRTR